MLAMWLIYLLYMGFMFWYEYFSIKRNVKIAHESLPLPIKHKIDALENEIETGLDPKLPRHSKYIDAWKEWSKQWLDQHFKVSLLCKRGEFFALYSDAAFRGRSRNEDAERKESKKGPRKGDGEG